MSLSLRNRVIALVLAFIVLLGSAAFALAQDTAQAVTSSSTPTETTPGGDGSTVIERGGTVVEERSERIEGREVERTDRTQERQNLREERQVALTEIRQQRILNLSANISNRMDAAIARLYAILARLETRIQKIAETGVDTTQANTKVREAATSLAEAKTLISSIDTLVYTAATSPTPYTAWQEVRLVYSEVGSLIRVSHQALREAIALLKNAPLVPAEPSAPEAETESATSTEL